LHLHAAGELETWPVAFDSPIRVKHLTKMCNRSIIWTEDR
jgi:hypothetical protein